MKRIAWPLTLIGLAGGALLASLSALPNLSMLHEEPLARPLFVFLLTGLAAAGFLERGLYHLTGRSAPLARLAPVALLQTSFLAWALGVYVIVQGPDDAILEDVGHEGFIAFSLVCIAISLVFLCWSRAEWMRVTLGRQLSWWEGWVHSLGRLHRRAPVALAALLALCVCAIPALVTGADLLGTVVAWLVCWPLALLVAAPSALAGVLGAVAQRQPTGS